MQFQIIDIEFDFDDDEEFTQHHYDNTTAHPIKEFFTESEWDLIYNFIGNALDDDDFDPDDVYSVRNKIHSIFDED